MPAKIIDIHPHIVSTDTERYPVTPIGGTRSEWSKERSATLEELVAEYATAEHGIEIRQVAGGYRMSTKPEQHDVVRDFAKSLKPPIRLSLPLSIPTT